MGKYQNTQRNKMMVSALPSAPSLEMTDYFFLSSIFLVLFWAVDPFRLSLDMVGGIKRMPTILLVMNLAFIALGRSLFNFQHKSGAFTRVVMDNKSLLAFSSLIIAGSLYAKYRSGIEETFLTMGMYIWMAPIAHWYTLNSRAPERLLRNILGLYVFWALVAAATQFVYFRKFEVFHNREHLVLPTLAAVCYFLPWKFSRIVAVAFVLGLAVAASKITGFILAIVILGYLMGLSLYKRVREQRDSLAKMIALIAAICVAVFTVATAIAAYRYFDRYMPSGNPEYRLYTYQLAFSKFKASPIWGVFFTKASVQLFDQFTVSAGTQTLPTHSDPLDILANGGLIAAALWLGGILPRLKSAFFDVCVSGRELNWLDELVHQAFFLIVLLAVVVCMFNPIHNIPNLATANWLAFGCMLTSTALCKKKLAARAAR
jgi:O-antigen ligase